MVRGRRFIAATAGVPPGWVSEKTTVRLVATLLGGQAVDPVLPGPMGPSESVVEAVVLVLSVPVAVAGFGVGDGVGLGVTVIPVKNGGADEEPPLQAVTKATRATAISDRRSILQPPENAWTARPTGLRSPGSTTLRALAQSRRWDPSHAWIYGQPIT
jgi:hypothetical protein